MFATTRETVVDDANGSSSQPKCANETTETKQNGSAPSRPTPVSSKETAFAAVAAADEAERVAAETKQLELFAAMTPGEQNACAAAEKKRAEAAVAVAKAEKTRAASVAKAKKERAEASVEKAKAKKERAASAAKATRGRAESAAAAAKAEKERAEAAVAAAKAEKERAASTAKTEKEAHHQRPHRQETSPGDSDSRYVDGRDKTPIADISQPFSTIADGRCRGCGRQRCRWRERCIGSRNKKIDIRNKHRVLIKSRQIETPHPFVHRVPQPFAQHLHAAVRRQLQVARARHRGRQVLVRQGCSGRDGLPVRARGAARGA